MQSRTCCIRLVAGWAAGAALAAVGTHALAETRQSVDAEVRFAPILAQSERQNVLRYELLLTDFAKAPLTLRRLDIVDASSGRIVGRLTGDALAGAVRPVGAATAPDSAILAPGRLNLVYVDLKLPSNVHPSRLSHRLTLSDGKSQFSIAGPTTVVRTAPPSDLRPPLKGGPWVAVYEPGMDGGHRRYAYAVNGRMTVPGRFAIDWFKLDKDGNQVPGTGAPVLAVADGTIAATRDDFADLAPGSKPLGSDLANDAGNYVTIELSDGRYAFYEHLKHGLLVKPGDKVRAGQVIAYLGSTGHVTGPHLHFHVANANSTLDAESIPFGFRHFERLGAYQSIWDFSDGRPWRRGPANGSGLPSPNEVVRFPG